MKWFLLSTSVTGLALAAFGFSNLKNTGEGIRHDRNPFALERSAYGKLLADLSQDTVNKVWHLGVEGVNPEHHDHGPGGHSHGDHGHDRHGHDHHDRDSAHHAEDHGHDHHDHDHGHGHGHDEGHDHHHGHEDDDEPFILTAEDLRHDHGAHGHEDADHGHDHHEGHDHGDHHDCEFCNHGEESDVEGEGLAGLITSAKDFLVDLKHARFKRTNPYGVNKAHKLHVAAEIERTLLRSYRMDPTNYGVYNAYYLFLTIHELRATPRARDHARLVSRHTISRAWEEDTDPSAWLTGAVAVLNLFFLDQEDWNAAGEGPDPEKIREYQQQMGYCLQQYQVLKQRAIGEGRWEIIPVDRRDAMEEREQFGRKTFEQFAAVLARVENSEGEKTSRADSEPPSAPVAETNEETDSSN